MVGASLILGEDRRVNTSYSHSRTQESMLCNGLVMEFTLHKVVADMQEFICIYHCYFQFLRPSI